MINEFKTYLVSIKGYAVNTAVAYEKDLRAFVQYVQRNATGKRWSTITREDVDRYIIHLSNTNHKPATICRHIASINALYKYMKREGLDVTNPAQYESRPKIGKSIPNTIPVDDLMLAMAKADGTTKILLRIFMETGIRVQELLDIRDNDIDEKAGKIIIRGKGNKEREVYISAETCAMLRAQKSCGRATVFADLTQREVRSRVWQALKGYTNARQLSPHAIRHTYATAMAGRGMTATTLQKALGHEHLETTQRYIDYAQISHEQECRQLSIFN